MGNFVGVEFYDIYMKNSWKNNKHLKFRPDTYRADLFHPQNSTISPFSSMPNFWRTTVLRWYTVRTP